LVSFAMVVVVWFEKKLFAVEDCVSSD